MKYYVKLQFAIGEPFGLVVDSDSAKSAEDKVRALAVECERKAVVVMAGVVMV